MNILEQVQTKLFADEAVIAAAVMGSMAAGSQDEWSDVDILLIIEGEARMQWRDVPLFGLEEHQMEEHITVHMFYADMQIIDFVLIDAKQLEANPSILYNFQAKPLKILFSKRPTILSLLAETHPQSAYNPMTDTAFEQWQMRFWYQVRYALQRLLRNDLLIALHLALELFQDVLVLRMVLRDRELGTNYHHSGGSGNDYVEKLGIHLETYSEKSILALIAAIVTEFDTLAQEFSPTYIAKKEAMLAFIEKIGASQTSAQSH